MPVAQKRLFLHHSFEGGFATDFGPTTSVGPDGNGRVALPFLTIAENVEFELDGGPRKVRGLGPLNGSALESGATVKGFYDMWLQGPETQHRIIHIGTKIKKDDGDGTFTDIGTGLVSGAVPCYAMLENLLVMGSDGGDVPKSWDGSTYQSLAGSPPQASIFIEHANRMWAAGVGTNPSRLYYSALLDPEDWVGAGSGSIDIAPDDKDRITAIYSHKKELIIFKGPNAGSIHRLTGSSPDDFAREIYVRGIGAAGQRTVFTLGDDLGFMSSDGTINALSVTAAYGDYKAAALSTQGGIRGWLDDYINRARLHHAQAVDWPDRGQIWFILPVNAAQDPNFAMIMDYRFQPVRFSLVPAFDMLTCLGQAVDSSDNKRHILMAGCNDGFVRKLGRSARSIDGSGFYAPRVKTPSLSWNAPIRKKTVAGGSVGIQPRNDGDFTVKLRADNGTDQSVTITQEGGDTLAPTSGTAFTLGTSVLGGTNYVDVYYEGDFGDGRTWSMEIAGPATADDLELHSLGLVVEVDGWSFENA